MSQPLPGTRIKVLHADLRDALISEGLPLVLDGAMGTELLRRGVPTPLPLWSAPALAEHADIVESIHRDYVSAGCHLVSTNTFRTSWYLMERHNPDAWETWNRRAVQLARRAAGDRAWVLGSVTTLEDCYRPDLVPEALELHRYHRRQVDLLVELGVDGLLLETFNTLRELDAAFDAAARHDLPVLASVVLRDAAHLYDRTPLAGLIQWARRARPDVLCVNCASPETLDGAVRWLREYLDVPVGAYANVGRSGGEMGFVFTRAYSPGDYARWCVRWTRLGVRVIGGCCGTTPDHMRAAASAVRHARRANEVRTQS